MDRSAPSELVELCAAARTLYDQAHHNRPDITVLEEELIAFQDLLHRAKKALSKQQYNLLAEDAAQVEVALDGFLSEHPNDALFGAIETLYADSEQLKLGRTV